MRDRLLVAVLIVVVAICEMVDIVSKIMHDYFLRNKDV